MHLIRLNIEVVVEHREVLLDPCLALELHRYAVVAGLPLEVVRLGRKPRIKLACKPLLVLRLELGLEISWIVNDCVGQRKLCETKC